MCKEVKHFKVPVGRRVVVTLENLFDRTPKNMISKLNPAGGVGALSAIQDAVALANWICALQSKEIADVRRIFREYRAEQYPVVKEAVTTSQMFKTLGGKGGSDQASAKAHSSMAVTQSYHQSDMLQATSLAPTAVQGHWVPFLP
ncbi:hypothetical protein BGZ92_011940 [Podila epicladia]|nr:hypothetical protein BGZ92_011940 [Podila epicladia]